MVLGVHGKYIYICLYLHLVDFLMVHVGKYTIHGSYGYIIIHPKLKKTHKLRFLFVDFSKGNGC